MNPNLPPHQPYGMPPVPRDHDRASASEIIPFASSKIRIWKSPAAYLLLLSAILAPLLLFLGDDALGEAGVSRERQIRAFIIIELSAIFFFIMLIQMAIYLYARPGKTVFAYLWPFAFVVAVMTIPGAMRPFFWLFREVLPGGMETLPANAGFFQLFIAMFFGAGLMEEFLKGIPILIGGIIGLVVTAKPGHPSGIARFFMVRGPLDGVLMGIFAGGAFVVIETGLQYVLIQADEMIQNTRNLNEGWAAGLMLLLPRVIRSLTGHMAYAAIFGYFIGLGVVRRRHFVPLILGGFLLSSLLHALWNSVGLEALNYMIALLVAIIAAGALLKARQLHHSLHGEPEETGGSIVIDRSGGGAPAAPAYQPQPQAYGGYSPQPQPYGGYPPPAPSPYGHYPAPPAPQGGFPAPPQPYGQATAGYGQGGYPQPLAAPPLPPRPEAAPPPIEPPAPPPAAEQAPEPPARPPLPLGLDDLDIRAQAPTETFAANVAPPPPPTAAEGEPMLALDIEGLVIPIRAGATVDLAAEPALGGRGAGVRAEIVPHPSRAGVLGVRNAGDRAWTAHLRDGRVQTIEPNQNVRLASGVTIDFGGGVSGSVKGG